MNLTLALLAGLVLLLPGIAALAAWNYLGSTQGARRPELQLTSVSALFMALAVALLMHVLGYGLTTLAWSAAAEIGRALPSDFPRSDLIPHPYHAALNLSRNGPVEPLSIFAFVLIVLAESVLIGCMIASPGFDLALDGADVRSQGWVFDHIVRPTRHGYKPIAYVLTIPAQGDLGLGYEGVVADVRQGDNGELKVLCLAEPQGFVYRMASSGRGASINAKLRTYSRKWIGGVVALDATAIRNVVVHNVPAELLGQIAVDVSTDDVETGEGVP